MMVDFGKNDMMPHFIYCRGDDYYFNIEQFKFFEETILIKMQKYGIQSSIFTTLTMNRLNLITKEKSKEAAQGKLENNLGEFFKGSINDDLDSFVKNLQNSGEIDNENVYSFFTPKLTKEELKLVEQKNKEHMKTYWFNEHADVDVEEMQKSDSKDKYVYSQCRRVTTYLTLESEQTLSEGISLHDFSENLSEGSFEDFLEDVLSDVSSDVQSTTKWATGLDAGVVARKMGNEMGRKSDDQPDDPSNHLRSSTRRRNSPGK